MNNLDKMLQSVASRPERAAMLIDGKQYMWCGLYYSTCPHCSKCVLARKIVTEYIRSTPTTEQQDPAD